MNASSQDELTTELYGLPLDEFTTARDALATRLRAGGDREAAQQVKRLRKPSVTAWAVNRLCHREPERVQKLLGAGAQLRLAQERVIGSGDRGGLRDAVARERELVEELVELAAAELSASGHVPNHGIRSRLFSTLHAAVGDDQVRALLAAGRLLADHELSDLGLGAGEGEAGAPLPARSPSSPRPATPPEQADLELSSARGRLEAAIDARHRAREELDAAERHARAAETALADAEHRWREAGAAAEQAESEFSHAKQELESLVRLTRGSTRAGGGEHRGSP
jgi:hypothetical protein